MQRLAPLLAVLAAIWLTGAQAATPTQAADYIIWQNAAPLKPLFSPPPGQAAVPVPPAAPAAVAAPQPAVPERAPIAVLLPLKSEALGDAADVVRAGIVAAQGADQGPAVRMYDTTVDNVAQRYREAVANGARVVIGPLTRPAIAQLAPRVTVPTLALNTLDGTTANPKLFGLSVSAELEARQIARLMRQDGMQRPAVITGSGVLDRRLAAAFASEWTSAAQTPPRSLAAHDPALAGHLAGADSVFLALIDPAAVPAAVSALPRYAVSQLAVAHVPAALTGVKVVDMPWLVMARHPAVQRYPRPAEALTRATERLYALGIDAYRVARDMTVTPPPPGWRLDGVTGDLKLGRDRQFARTLPVQVLEGQ
ncbi:penicillin-binding protein activator [Microvirgula curvata]